MVVVETATNPHVFLIYDNMQNPLRQPRKTTYQLPKVVRDRQFLTLLTSKCFRATTACTFSTSQLPKMLRNWCVLYILTWKCALRHNGVHFFDISTSKSAPNLVCFARFDLKMCFAPQRRAFFGHPGVFCTF